MYWSPLHPLIASVWIFLFSLPGISQAAETNATGPISSETAPQAISRLCGTCHSLNIKGKCFAGDCDPRKTKTISAANWSRITQWMRDFNCKMTNQEQRMITEFLQERFPRKPFPLTWSRVGQAPIGWNIVSLKSIGDHLYMGIEGGGRIYRSPDGMTWEELVDTGLVSVYGITPFKGKIMAGGDGNRAEIWSSPEGVDWSRIATLPETELGVSALGEFKGHLYAGTRRANLFRSEDGQSWEKLVTLATYPGKNGVRPFSGFVRFLTEFNGYLFAGIEPQGKVFRSADGLTWEETAKEILPHVGVRGNAVFKGSFYLGTTGPPTIWKTDDGEKWELVFEPTPDLQHGYAGSMAVFKDKLYAGIHVHSDPRKDLFRTTDGIHWESVGEISPHTIESMAPFGEFLYAGSLFPPQAQIYRSSGLQPSSVHTAEGETSARAERTGSYLDTQTAYNLPETLSPIPKNSGWDMEHTWRFSINAGELLTLGVKAIALKTDSSAALSPGEAYLFSYSRDGRNFTPFFNIEKETEKEKEKEKNPVPYSLTTIKDVTGGEFFIRVTGKFKMKSDIKSSLPPPVLHVDHLYLLSEGKPKTRKRS